MHKRNEPRLDSLNVNSAHNSGDASDVADAAATMFQDPKERKMLNELTPEAVLALLMLSFEVERTPPYGVEQAAEDLFKNKEIMYYQDSLGSYPVTAVPYASVLEVLEKLRKAGA